MKLKTYAGLLVTAAFVVGCASRERGLVLDPVGPPPLASNPIGTTGTLMVFSAYEQNADFDTTTYRREYTDYAILSANGRPLQTVKNDIGDLSEIPRQVPLPPGSYKVIARANGYGEVTVPVVIRAGQVTTIHLEGSPSWPHPGRLAGSNPVRLPDGEIAGWRAAPNNSPRP
jgi:hypothetical protein